MELPRGCSRLALLALAAVALGGCSERSNEPSTQRESPATVDPGPSAAELEAQREDARREAIAAKRTERRRAVEGAVRDFYSEVESTQYEKAWGRLTAASQSAFGGFEKWKEGYGTTVSLSPVVTATSASPTIAEVRVELRSKDLDECSDEVTQTWAGTWTVVRSGSRWLLDAQSFRKTAGGEVVRDAASCPGYVPPYETSSEGPGADPTDPYDDAPEEPVVPPEYGDAPTTQDFGSGKGSVGLCADGTLSDSIGRQGACSHHGGVP